MIESDILVSPMIEPISVDEAKTWLKIEGPDDDLLLAGLISSARLTVEALTGLLLINQTWRFRIPVGKREQLIRLPHRPLSSLSAAQLRDHRNVTRLVPLDGISIDRAAIGTLVIADDRNFNLPNFAFLEVDAIMGFGPTPTSVPPPLLTAIRMLIAFWHERRGDDAQGVVDPWPPTLSAILEPYRDVKL